MKEYGKITSIEFHKNGVVPTSYETSFDVTDTISDPSKGNITLYTVDDESGNNTYKAIIVANDTIYAPENSVMLFANMAKLISFNSFNFKVDNVTNMAGLFFNCRILIDVSSLSIWNTNKIKNFAQMFSGCASLSNIKTFANWDVSNITNMSSMFADCINLVDASGINNWNISASAYFSEMFGNGTPSHPEFTKFPNGTWDSNGTFIPNA